MKHLRPSDLRGFAQLATQATEGVATMAEGVHQAVWGTMGAEPSAQTRGLTGFVYRAVHGVTTLVGQGLAAGLTKLEPVLESLVDAPTETPEREAVLAALNGVLGDRLVASNNPLATPMTLRHQHQALVWGTPAVQATLSAATPKVLVLIHGLCMNDLQWHTQVNGSTPVDHGAALAQALGYTPVYVRYNTGLHTSENGAALAHQLAQLVQHWPMPVQELSIVAHSMGGLVTRSAVHWAQTATKAKASAGTASHSQWLAALKSIVFLGTPHHGAPLERAGNWVDVVLGGMPLVSPFTKPFAKLGQLRSAGITDLRFGNVCEADWLGVERFKRQSDRRAVVPLPEGIACFTVAATVAAARSPLVERLVGDRLVPLDSALGQHSQPQRSLVFAKTSQWVAYRMNHMELLSSPKVTNKLLEWLGR
jgi:pimeloyl-ACP methyl ester carboxylesterase